MINRGGGGCKIQNGEIGEGRKLIVNDHGGTEISVNLASFSG